MCEVNRDWLENMTSELSGLGKTSEISGIKEMSYILIGVWITWMYASVKIYPHILLYVDYTSIFFIKKTIMNSKESKHLYRKIQSSIIHSSDMNVI